ncbi:6-phosphogluconolactonase [Nocardioides donggukensis]|uniref:6-phosphogluconolactonase n=1 Tax=Nocardioides donggukensis TaxID=2774019 RepID=A0A927K591_9ACTN|nr:6-phosphogluconolactonase [Nocardioides donggukensis]MBD8869375.1 6-phosphogluconolactonase [Nocardioides donggukensis]
MNPVVERYGDKEALAEAVAARLLERLAVAQAEGRVPQVVLTGGSVADAVHRALARLTPQTRVDWSRVGLWWGDERFVAPDDADRNAGQARAALLDAVAPDPALVHEMPSSADAADVQEGAAAYAATLAAHGPETFDVVMLGVGPDGHVASLFPGHPALAAEDLDVVGVTGSPKPPPERISLTLDRLNRTRAVWLVAAGAEKAEAVAGALAGAPAFEVPAAAVHGLEETVLHLDEAAAGRL